MKAWEARQHLESGVKCLIVMVFILLLYVLMYAFVICRLHHKVL